MSMIYANQIERVNLYRQTDRHMNRVVLINIWQTTTEEIQYQSSTEQIHRQAQNARS